MVLANLTLLTSLRVQDVFAGFSSDCISGIFAVWIHWSHDSAYLDSNSFKMYDNFGHNRGC